MAGHSEEKVTEGLDDLAERLRQYARMGARFTKWRAVIALGEAIPSRACLEANAVALARFAASSQAAGLLPIVESDVLMEGDHTLARCRAVTEEALHTLFAKLHLHEVLLEGMLLKTNMVLPGLAHRDQAAADEVAETTVGCLRRSVPPAVPGIVFLSGGQSGELASARLNAMNRNFQGRLPWVLSFSFSRALQQPALEIWSGIDSRKIEAQQALLHRARCDSAARRGEYGPAVEQSQRPFDLPSSLSA